MTAGETGGRPNRSGGMAMIMFTVALVAWFVIERVSGVDPDDAEASVAHIRAHPRNYVVAGLLLWIMALGLTVAVSAVSETVLSRSRSATVFGFFSAGFFLLQGVLRVSTPGTLSYIDDLDHTWGTTAHLAVHMIGTQGLVPAGVLALSIWAVWLAVANSRSRVLPRAVTVMALFPGLLILMGVMGPMGVGFDALYLVYVGSFLGLIPWCLVLGMSLLRVEHTASLDAS